MNNEIPEHGTVLRYRRHMRTDGAPCDECRVAWNAYAAQKAAERRERRAKGEMPPRQKRTRDNSTPETITHGEVRGYRAHIKLGVTPCATCRAAKAAYDRQYQVARPSRDDIQRVKRDRAKEKTRIKRAKERARHAAEMIREPGVVRQTRGEMSDLEYVKVRTGWAFNCPREDCGFGSHIYREQATAELIQHEHLARVHDSPKAEALHQSAQPKVRRTGGRTLQTRPTAA